MKMYVVTPHLNCLNETILMNGSQKMREIRVIIPKPAIAAMHGLHSVSDIGYCTVIHCDARGMSLVDE